MERREYVYLTLLAVLFLLVLTGYGSKLGQDAQTLLFERTTECEIEKSLHRENSSAIMNITEIKYPLLTSSKGQVHFDYDYSLQVSGYAGPSHSLYVEDRNECQMNFVGAGKYSCKATRYDKLYGFRVEISFNSTLNPLTSKCNSIKFEKKYVENRTGKTP